MKNTELYRLGLTALWLLSCSVLADDSPTTGPATEQRFPRLKLPSGFEATLFACDPLIEYPSVISLGPKLGSLFVAHDYVTGLGVEIVRRDEIRLISDTDGDGYADTSTVFAEGFNSIQGLTYHDGTVFAMHSPRLTALRDLDGDGVADERRDLLDGLGLAPEDNSSRLHCGNGLIVGHDGWLYLALGDNGCDVKRPEGDRFLFQQGGVLRCRTDGTDLHMFSGGLRNIYDVALDEELNVFVRDNENDGGDYKIRIYHALFGADHGYPYLYYERPSEALRPLADLGLGAAAGGVCYLEDAFPPHFRGLFFCEWGRAVMHFPRTRSGSTFANAQETEFAAGAENDPYGFKPTDAVVDRDGSLLVSDWADGQRPKRGRGRIYRIRYSTAPGGPALHQAVPFAADSPLADLLRQLDSTSYQVRLAAHLAIQRRAADGLPPLRAALAGGELGRRARLHTIWLLVQAAGPAALDELFQIAETDSHPSVRAQAVRAIADLTDPVLVEHRLDSRSGDPAVADRLARLAARADPRVVLECVIAFGRLGWSDAPQWLAEHLTSPDQTLAHAAMQTLRRCENWTAVVQLLAMAPGTPIREIAGNALARQYKVEAVDGLIRRLSESSGESQAEAADLLTRVHRKPAPWKYWGYRPAPRAANTVSWQRTERIEQALDRLLRTAKPEIKAAALTQMQREAVPVRLSTIADWLAEEREPGRVAVLLKALAEQPIEEVRPLLIDVIQTPAHATANRLAALGALSPDSSQPADPSSYLRLAQAIEDGPILANVLRKLGQRSTPGADDLLLTKISAPVPAVRAAAIAALGELGVPAAVEHVADLLNDADLEVRRAAAQAAGQLKAHQTADLLLRAASRSDGELRRAALVALHKLGEARAVPQAVAALEQTETQLAALDLLHDLGDAAQLEPVKQVAAANRSMDVLGTAVRVMTRWQHHAAAGTRSDIDRVIARLQGESGLILRWAVHGPLPPLEADRQIHQISAEPAAPVLSDSGGSLRIGQGTDAKTRLTPDAQHQPDQAWLAISDVLLDQEQQVDVLASSSGLSRIWFNGQQVYQREKPDRYRTDSDRFAARLRAGKNRLVVRLAETASPELHLRFIAQSSSADDAAYIQHALKTPGSSKRGQEIFANTEKSRCLKCHRMNDQGARIGPDLTGIGSRFSRIHLIESVLEPSRTIAPSYQTVSIVRTNGQVISGVRVAEDAETVTVADNQGKSHTVQKSEIDDILQQTTSTMPEQLEKELTKREFTDLIAFLLSQQEANGQ